MYCSFKNVYSMSTTDLTLILLMRKIWWAPNNAGKWQIGFNSAFKGLKCQYKCVFSKWNLGTFCVEWHYLDIIDLALSVLNDITWTSLTLHFLCWMTLLGRHWLGTFCVEWHYLDIIDLALSVLNDITWTSLTSPFLHMSTWCSKCKPTQLHWCIEAEAACAVRYSVLL